MALKDWEKVKNRYNIEEDRWYNKRRNVFLVIDYIKERKYNVAEFDAFATYLRRAFKTKSQALKFAKNYMRKH